MARALLVVLLVLLPCAVRAQSLEFHAPASVNDARTPQVMRDLAERIIPVYNDTDRERYLANLSALQLVAGSYAAAYAARLSLAELRHQLPGAASAQALVADLHARAKALQTQEGVAYAQGFARSFEDVVGSQDDLAAYRLIQALEIPPALFEGRLQRAFDQHRTGQRIEMADALDLIWSYLTFDAHRNFAPLLAALVAADEQRRYVLDPHVVIRTADGASLSAVLVRPRSAAKPLPTLLELSIDLDTHSDATECAAHGYAGVVAYARGMGESPEKVVPYEHEGEDARAVIAWISAQGWSDGRVGMYGTGYSAFAAWAAAGRAPAALRALVTGSATAPGIDLPMEGNIFRNEAYRWLLHITHYRDPDQAIYRDAARWRAFDERWYASGKPYRELDRLYGVPSPIFQRWLTHPSYDQYWQRMIPGPRALAQLGIPVLTLTGYYDPGEAGAVHYFTQHHRYNPHADHTLVIGPYDSQAVLRGPVAMLGGYSLDAAALIDLHELRYQWLDHVLRGGARPAVLASRVNYQIMGTETWRHASSLDEPRTALRLYLDPSAAAGVLRLTQDAPARKAFVLQTVNFAARDAPVFPDAMLLTRSLPGGENLVFVSEPLPAPVELAGRPQLQLDLITNKVDFDLTVALYEQLPDGQYLRLYDPPYEQRASYAHDRSARRVLQPGRLEHLTLPGARLLGRRTRAGSRLVLVLGVKKRPDEQINYGTGKDVSQESLADARRPLTIRWYGSSHLDIPVWK